MRWFITLLGGAIWASWWWMLGPSLTTALLMAGPLLMVPLGLIADQGVRTSWQNTASWLQLPAALLLLLSVGQPQGWSATVLALPWFLVTLLLAFHGLARLLPRHRHRPAELCIDAAYVFIIVGGAWVLLDRFGARPLGYDPLIVQLTAIHFHFAGYVLPLLAGLLGRSRPEGTPSIVAIGVLGGIPLVAGGLVQSQLTGDTTGEWIASWTLAIAGASVALLQLLEARHRRGLIGVLLGLSAVSLLVGMFFAAAYGFSRAQGALWPTIADMIAYHGVTNALGFSLLGILAYAAAPPAAPQHLPTPPGRGLWARGAVGNGWFLAEDLADPRIPAPQGQLSQMSDLDSEDFSSHDIHPSVRAFYEQTTQHELWVRPRWPWLLSFPARLYVGLARQMGQLVLPLDRGGAWQQVLVRTFGADESLKLPNAHLYERRYANGTPMFIAAYTTLTHTSRPYLGVILPLPFCSLIGVLRPENMGDGGIRLRSVPANDTEVGLFLDTLIAPIRLPLHEDLILGPLDAGFAPGPSDAVPNATLCATHRFTIAGIHCLDLEYLICRSDA
jgi:hypothetical protein